LARCLLGQGVPVLFKTEYYLEPFILLDQQQAYKVDAKDLTISCVRDGKNKPMWILVDSMAFPNGMPQEFLLNKGPTSMLVCASSPRPSRWTLTEQYNIRLQIIFMNPWSKWKAELL
jgi:hypothetical protein